MTESYYGTCGDKERERSGWKFTSPLLPVQTPASISGTSASGSSGSGGAPGSPGLGRFDDVVEDTFILVVPPQTDKDPFPRPDP